MPTLQKVRSGQLAKLSGQQFENLIAGSAARERVVLVRIPDGCRTLRSAGGPPKLVRARSPFDFVAFHKGYAIAFDAKSVDAETFPCSSIDRAQLHHLLRCEPEVSSSGYLVYFRPSRKVVFFEASTLNRVTRGRSLRAEDGYDLGDIDWIRLRDLFHVPEIDTKACP